MKYCSYLYVYTSQFAFRRAVQNWNVWGAVCHRAHLKEDMGKGEHNVYVFRVPVSCTVFLALLYLLVPRTRFLSIDMEPCLQVADGRGEEGRVLHSTQPKESTLFTILLDMALEIALFHKPAGDLEKQNAILLVFLFKSTPFFMVSWVSWRFGFV